MLGYFSGNIHLEEDLDGPDSLAGLPLELLNQRKRIDGMDEIKDFNCRSGLVPLE